MKKVFVLAFVMISILGIYSFKLKQQDEIKRTYASHYGGKFHGRKTASGEIFDTTKLTAAHRKLPFNTLVKVTNPKNGKSVIVRINDRGPFHRNRGLDLSRAAFSQIGNLKSGVIAVDYQVITEQDYQALTKKDTIN